MKKICTAIYLLFNIASFAQKDNSGQQTTRPPRIRADVDVSIHFDSICKKICEDFFIIHYHLVAGVSSSTPNLQVLFPINITSKMHSATLTPAVVFHKKINADPQENLPYKLTDTLHVAYPFLLLVQKGGGTKTQYIKSGYDVTAEIDTLHFMSNGVGVALSEPNIENNISSFSKNSKLPDPCSKLNEPEKKIE